MTENGLLRSPASDGRHTDLEGPRNLGDRHPAIEGCQHADTQVFGVGFHASHATTRSMFLHLAIMTVAWRLAFMGLAPFSNDCDQCPRSHPTRSPVWDQPA